MRTAKLDITDEGTLEDFLGVKIDRKPKGRALEMATNHSTNHIYTSKCNYTTLGILLNVTNLHQRE